MKEREAEYLPTLEEIAAACHEFRSGWTSESRDYRGRSATHRLVKLAVGILRPLAEETGMVSRRTRAASSLTSADKDADKDDGGD
jgi:hypothetical protein